MSNWTWIICVLKKYYTTYASLVSQNSKLMYRMLAKRLDNTNFDDNTFCSMVHFILRIGSREDHFSLSSQCFLLIPLRTSGNLWLPLVSWCFRGERPKGDIGKKRVKELLTFIRILRKPYKITFFISNRFISNKLSECNLFSNF